jgi:hypothetical protein
MHTSYETEAQWYVAEFSIDMSRGYVKRRTYKAMISLHECIKLLDQGFPTWRMRAV